MNTNLIAPDEIREMDGGQTSQTEANCGGGCCDDDEECCGGGCCGK